jgi:6-pyruvoyltetrahydropterin/6-carboxytetrahydropterin synthase
MFEITKQFEFSASHQLLHLSDSHPCKRMHGHNYVVKFTLRSKKLNTDQFVQDYRELSGIKAWIDQNFDHRHLNDVMPVAPTAENIAKHLFDTFYAEYPLLVEVSVSETPKTSASYRIDYE